MKKHLPDFLMFFGACACSYGAWLMYPPAGFMLGGALSIGMGVLIAKVTK